MDNYLLHLLAVQFICDGQCTNLITLYFTMIQGYFLLHSCLVQSTGDDQTVYMPPPPPMQWYSGNSGSTRHFSFSDLSWDLIQCLDDDLHIMTVQLICDENFYFTAKSNKFICIFIYVHTLAHNFVTIYPI